MLLAHDLRALYLGEARTRTGVFGVIWQLTIDNLLLRESHSFTG